MAINQSICHYKKSNYIKNMKDLWVSDIKTHNDMIYKYESKIIKNETTYKELFNKYFKNYYKIDIYKIDEYISPKDSKNENTIIVFNWDKCSFTISAFLFDIIVVAFSSASLSLD